MKTDLEALEVKRYIKPTIIKGGAFYHGFNNGYDYTIYTLDCFSSILAKGTSSGFRILKLTRP